MKELNQFREFLNAEVVTLDELNDNMEQWTVADVIELKKMIGRTLDYEVRAERAKVRLEKMFDKFENKVQGKGLMNAYQLKGTEHMVDVVNMMFPDNDAIENPEI
jgi:acetylornithine/succinyldiaminopimelate/putrescine aminotransferase